MAKCSVKVRSCPASHFLPSLLTLSQQNHAPCWKLQARASQSPSRGSLMVLAASSSTRHTPCRPRPGNRRTREPWQSTRGTNEERGEKTSTQVWSGLCSQCQCKLCSGQMAVLAPAVNTQKQVLLFCPFAKHLTHAQGEPRPDGGLRGSGRQERQPVIQQHCWCLVMNGNMSYKVVFLSTFQLARWIVLAACFLSDFTVPPHHCSIPSCRRLTCACNLKPDRQRGNCFLWGPY